MSSTLDATALPADRPFPRSWLVPVGVGRWLFFCTAVLQAVSPALISFGGSGQEPPVVPAGYTFSIWSAVIGGCLVTHSWDFRGDERHPRPSAPSTCDCPWC